MTPLLVAPEEITFDEFLVRYDGCFAEWVDGRVWMEDLSDLRRSRLKGFLTSVLQSWAEVRELGQVYLAPFTVRLAERIGLEPDLFFVHRENVDRVRFTHVEGAPNLVVEIVSRGVRANTYVDRLPAYESAGVPEVWLIDVDRCVAEAWRLGTDGTYEPVALGDPAALRADCLPGMWIPIEWLWQEPLPRLTEVQKAWRLI